MSKHTPKSFQSIWLLQYYTFGYNPKSKKKKKKKKRPFEVR